MTWKEKQTVTILVSILAILSAILLIVLGIRYQQNRPSAQGTGGASTDGNTGGPTLSAAYTEISYSNSTATLTFTLDEEGNWTWADGPDFPLDSLTVTAIADELSNLKFQQTLPATESMESYGLDNPSASLSATDGQGVLHTLAFGKTTTDGDSYYIQMNGDESTVYIISDTLYKYMQTPIYDMCVLPELPDLAEENLISLTVQGPVPETESSEEGGEPAEAPSPLTTLLVAHHSDEHNTVWFHGNDNVSENARVSGLLEDMKALTIAKCIDYHPSSEASGICGFDAPSAVLTADYGSIGTEQSLVLTVGNQIPDGSGRYVRLNGEDPIYLLLTEYLDPLMSIAASGLAES